LLKKRLPKTDTLATSQERKRMPQFVFLLLN